VFQQWLKVTLFCLLLVSGVPWSAADEIPFGQGLLFKATAADGRVSHVFGTVHSDDPRVVKLPEPVDRVFAVAKRVALEIEMEPSIAVTLMVSMMLADGRTLSDVIGLPLYRRLQEVAATRGIPEVGLRQYKPWAIATMLSMPPAKTGGFLDLVLAQRAQARGVEVVGLETVQEQLALFEGLTDREQTILLEDVLNNYSKLPLIHEQLLATYLDQDLRGLVELSEDMAQSQDKALNERFQKALVDDRNVRMADRIEMIQVDQLFVAVGALHLPGVAGVLALLQKKGYQIERVF